MSLVNRPARALVILVLAAAFAPAEPAAVAQTSPPGREAVASSARRAEELVRHLRETYGKGKIVLVAHS